MCHYLQRYSPEERLPLPISNTKTTKFTGVDSTSQEFPKFLAIALNSMNSMDLQWTLINFASVWLLCSLAGQDAPMTDNLVSRNRYQTNRPGGWPTAGG